MSPCQKNLIARLVGRASSRCEAIAHAHGLTGHDSGGAGLAKDMSAVVACTARRKLRDTCKAYSAFIGLTGGIAAGKSHAREFLASLGALHAGAAAAVVAVDADLLGHAAYAVGTPAYAALVAEFGARAVLAPDGEFRRHGGDKQPLPERRDAQMPLRSLPSHLPFAMIPPRARGAVIR
jgi:hypothetical protein